MVESREIAYNRRDDITDEETGIGALQPIYQIVLAMWWRKKALLTADSSCGSTEKRVYLDGLKSPGGKFAFKLERGTNKGASLELRTVGITQSSCCAEQA